MLATSGSERRPGLKPTVGSNTRTGVRGRNTQKSQEDPDLALQEMSAFWAFALEPPFRAADRVRE